MPKRQTLTTTHPITPAAREGASVFSLDQRTQRELVAYTNRTQAQVEWAREAMQAISHILLYGEYQVSLAMIATKAIEHNLAAAGVSAEEYLVYHQMLRHEYLQRMAAVMHKATDAIDRQFG